MSMSKETIKYEVCFIQTSFNSKESSENLKLAFEAMDSNQLEPFWIAEEECLKVSRKEQKLYVMDPFEGEVFNHLKSLGCRVIGPLCILYCLQCGDILPKRPHPVYSVSMRKITVSCSNIDNACREDIRQKVELMGGLFSKDFTKSVTHLVVGEVGSKKYQVAANFNLPIMTPDWVEDVWRNGQHKQLHATDSSFRKYKCPVFKGLIITVSQLTSEERSEIRSIVEENGGSYLAPLKARETTHLVLSEPVGDKYRYAKTWKIFCVNVKWIYESVEAGYCKDENLYKIENTSNFTQPKRSTPNRDMTSRDLPLVDCSAITNVSTVTHLDETMKSDVSIPVTVKKNSRFSSLEEFNLSSLPKYGQFLDGCKIFLTGFNSTHLDKLRKIVNSGGGMRFSKYSESISHVVCGDLTEDFLQSLKSSSVKPYVVNLGWLLECCNKESLVDEKPFLCMDVTPLSPEKDEPEVKSLSVSQTSKSQPRNDDATPDNITDILKQYICEQNDDGNSKENYKKSATGNRESSVEPKSRTLEQDAQGNEDIDVIDLVEDEDVTSSVQLFAGLKFVIVGFGEKDTEILAKMIETHTGRVFINEASSNADIAIVPIIKHDYITCASNIITNCWLQKCIEDSRIYDFDENELFNPIEIPSGIKPFESFVISVSQYSGTERDCLMHLAEVLGATCQEYFVRKANKSRGILSNTHLIVATPDGSKYDAAKKWKIPAVTKQWVLDTARFGSALPVDKYLVDVAVSLQVNDNISPNTAAPLNSMEKENVNQDIAQQLCTDNPNTAPRRSISAKSSIENDIKIIKQPNITELAIDKKLEAVKAIDHSSTPQRHVTKLCNEGRSNFENMSPVVSKPELSMSESLNLNQSYKYKFHVSGLLKDLDSSVSQEHSMSTSMKRQSLPVEELFGKNLASAIRGVNNRMLSSENDDKLESDKNSFIDACPPPDVDSPILKGVILCVSKKLTHLQNELNEIVTSLGGDYQWAYDSTCTHFIFTGKANDLAKEFREAKAQGKKIVCPEWIYACKEKNLLVDEELYPHTLKLNMSLTSEIAIVKSTAKNNISGNENVSPAVKQDPPKDALPRDGNAVDFNQQLNDLLVAAKSAKRRQSKRLLNSVSSSPNNEKSPIHKLQKQISDSLIKPAKTEENGIQDEPDTCSQQSQSYPIVWDDPTGRMEREKIAALTAAYNVKENIPITSNTTGDGFKINSIKTNSSVMSCDGLVEEVFMDFPKSALDMPGKSSTKKFMFTNIPEPKKMKYIEIISQLGGDVSDEKAFDLTATHLILEKPIKNEKLLCSVASGKWILHPQYLTVSQEQEKFASEEDFEWGGPRTSEFLHNLPISSKKIASCPFRWRLKLTAPTDLSGAFHEWKVAVIAEDKAKQSTYAKILEAGGAEVVPSETSNSVLEKLSHVIVDMKKRTLPQLDLGPYISHSIKCVKPEYLAFFLIEDPSPDVESFIIPEAKELMGTTEQTLKRRNLSVATRGNKRTRLT